MPVRSMLKLRRRETHDRAQGHTAASAGLGLTDIRD